MSTERFEVNNHTMVIHLKEDLDHHNAAIIKEKIDGFIYSGQAKNVIFDFKQTNFMDSSGIGMIMGRYKSIQKNSGKIAITGLQPTVKKIVKMSGLYKILEEYDNLDVALNKLNVV